MAAARRGSSARAALNRPGVRHAALGQVRANVQHSTPDLQQLALQFDHRRLRQAVVVETRLSTAAGVPYVT